MDKQQTERQVADNYNSPLRRVTCGVRTQLPVSPTIKVWRFLLAIGLSTLAVWTFYQGGMDPQARQLTATLRKPSQNTPCSMSIIRDHIASNKGFPWRGNWSESGSHLHFVPRICSFPYVSLPAAYLNSCFRKKDVFSILLLGDSNGRRYHSAFMEILQNGSNYVCKTIKEESQGSSMPDASYYSQDTHLAASDIVVHDRDCITCRSILSNCTNREGTSLMLQYVSMEFLIDTEVTTLRADKSKRQSNTYQEFLFDEYLSATDDYYPDVIVIFGNSHEIVRNPISKVRSDLVYLLSIIQRSVPETTRVIWLPVHGHYQKRRYVNWDKLTAVNRVWFNILKPHIVREYWMHGFFNLQELSREVLPQWVDDSLGVHLKKVWYERIVSYVMQTLCNEDERNGAMVTTGLALW